MKPGRPRTSNIEEHKTRGVTPNRRRCEPTDRSVVGALVHRSSSLLRTDWGVADTGGGNWRAHTHRFPGGLVDQAAPPRRKSRAAARLFPCPTARASPETAATRSPPPQHPEPRQQQCPPRSLRPGRRSPQPADPPAPRPATPGSRPCRDAAGSSTPHAFCAFVKRYGLGPRNTLSPRFVTPHPDVGRHTSCSTWSP